MTSLPSSFPKPSSFPNLRLLGCIGPLGSSNKEVVTHAVARLGLQTQVIYITPAPFSTASTEQSFLAATPLPPHLNMLRKTLLYLGLTELAPSFGAGSSTPATASSLPDSDDLWILDGLAQLSVTLTGHHLVIFTDVTTPVQADTILAVGGQLVRILNPFEPPAVPFSKSVGFTGPTATPLPVPPDLFAAYSRPVVVLDNHPPTAATVAQLAYLIELLLASPPGNPGGLPSAF